MICHHGGVRNHRLSTLAVVAATLAIVLGATGCATRNGSVDAFCAQLPKTAAASSFSPELLATMTPSKVSDHLRKASTQLRDLERVAPRKVRDDVATTADFAQRYAAELDRVIEEQARPGYRPTVSYQPAPQPYDLGPSGTALDYYDRWSMNPVFQAFNAVSRSYPGALKATATLTKYAIDKCGPNSLPQGETNNGTWVDEQNTTGPVIIGPSNQPFTPSTIPGTPATTATTSPSLMPGAAP